MKYILINDSDRWGSEGFYGTEITPQEVNELAEEWGTPITELLADLEPDFSESDEPYRYYDSDSEEYLTESDMIYNYHQTLADEPGITYKEFLDEIVFATGTTVALIGG